MSRHILKLALWDARTSILKQQLQCVDHACALTKQNGETKKWEYYERVRYQILRALKRPTEWERWVRDD